MTAILDSISYISHDTGLELDSNAHSLQAYAACAVLQHLLSRFYAVIGQRFVLTWVLSSSQQGACFSQKHSLLPGLLGIVVERMLRYQLICNIKIKSSCASAIHIGLVTLTRWLGNYGQV